MKRFSYILTTVLALLMIAATLPFDATQLEITEDSRMWVDGTSTIHGWTCESGTVAGRMTLDANAGTISEAVVTVPAASIDCDNGTMNKKVAEALKIKAHPAVTYTLKNAVVTEDGSGLKVTATGALELAGTTKDVTVDLVGTPLGDGRYTFAGTLPLRMSNFGIKPPTAMLGTLKTGDDVTVRFEIVAAPAGGSLSSSK